MASAVIHLAVANEINKKIKRDKAKFLIGSIAPDISKQIGESKVKNHFLNGEDDIPNLDWFLLRYKNKLNDDFVLGYYVHLFTDYLWFKYFIPDIYKNKMITKLDGTVFECSKDTFIKYVYNDYTNLNVKLIDEYNLDLEIFYNKIPDIESIIEEIPINKLKIIVDKVGLIIANSKENKEFLFDLNDIKKFISLSVDIILSDLENIL